MRLPMVLNNKTKEDREWPTANRFHRIERRVRPFCITKLLPMFHDLDSSLKRGRSRSCSRSLGPIQQTMQHPDSLLALLLQSQIYKISKQTTCILLGLDVDLGLV